VQRLLDAISDCCNAIGMVIVCRRQRQWSVFGGTALHPPWHYKSEPLKQFDTFKYLGPPFSAAAGIEATLSSLKERILAAWGLLTRRYSNLSSTSSVGLLLIEGKAAVRH